MGSILRDWVNPGPGDFGVAYHTQGLDLNEIFSSPRRGVVRAGGLGQRLIDATCLMQGICGHLKWPCRPNLHSDLQVQCDSDLPPGRAFRWRPPHVKLDGKGHQRLKGQHECAPDGSDAGWLDAGDFYVPSFRYVKLPRPLMGG